MLGARKQIRPRCSQTSRACLRGPSLLITCGFSSLQFTNVLSVDASPAMRDIAAVATASLAWAQGNQRELKEWVAGQMGVAPPRAPLLVDFGTAPTPAPSTPAPTTPAPTTPATPAPPTALKAAADDASSADNSKWRLPDDLVPSNYKLDMSVDLDPDFPAYAGVVDITVTVAAATDKIVLHKHKDLKTAVTQVVEKGTNTPVNVNGEPSFNEETQFYTIALSEQLAVGKEYTVSLEFDNTLKKDLAGLYYSTYSVYGDEK